MTSSIKDDHASRIAKAGITPRSRAMRQADATKKRLRLIVGKETAFATLDVPKGLARKDDAIRFRHTRTATAGDAIQLNTPPSSPNTTWQVVFNFQYAIAA